VYWSGDAQDTLQGVANLADHFGKNHGTQATAWESWLDDGNAAPAVVGSYRANGFGLHDVHGNLWEWCQDGYDADFYGRSHPKDPLASWQDSGYRVYRGGSFFHGASNARSAFRPATTPASAGYVLGVRPARVLEE
jgi:formylglycine-generating enzyme required for sulfatase activity